ncbi:10759_t:CDS:1, partial [Acaulospora morrowiae]
TNMKWSFSSTTLGNFITNCQAPLEHLGFEFCESFSEKHMDVIIQTLKRPLKVLNIRCTNIKITPEIREKTRHMIQFIDGST